jgi:hypothetical protein
MTAMIHRVARALCGGLCNCPRRDGWCTEALTEAREVLTAMKYEDGSDEDSLIRCAAIERLDPVAGACFWDHMIDDALSSSKQG